MYKNLMLAVKDKNDGSKLLPAVESWAQLFNARLNLQTVVELMPLFTGDSGYFYDEIYAKEELALERAQKDLAELKAQCQYPQVAVNVEIGSLKRTMSEAMDECHSDLLVIGSHKHSIFDKWFGMDSTSSLSHCDSDVLSLYYDLDEKQHPFALRNILLCVDLSDATEVLIKQAKELQELSGANVALIHVIKKGSSKELSDYERELFELAGTRLDEWAASFDQDCVTKTVRFGDTADQLADYARENDFDLIIVGRKHENLKEIFTGTTADELVAKSECDVLALRV